MTWPCWHDLYVLYAYFTPQTDPNSSLKGVRSILGVICLAGVSCAQQKTDRTTEPFKDSTLVWSTSRDIHRRINWLWRVTTALGHGGFPGIVIESAPRNNGRQKTRLLARGNKEPSHPLRIKGTYLPLYQVQIRPFNPGRGGGGGIDFWGRYTPTDPKWVYMSDWASWNVSFTAYRVLPGTLIAAGWSPLIARN